MTLALPARGRPPRQLPRQLPGWLPAVGGIVSLLLVWTLIGSTVLSERKGLPTPWQVVVQAHTDGWSFYWPLIKGTASRALPGFLVGNGIALAMALLVVALPVMEKLVLQAAVGTYCIPVVAIGPILTITLTGDHPIEALAALFVIFTTLVGTLLGLRSADPTSLDLVRAYGGGSLMQMRKVRVIAALPSTFAALKIAAPTAVLGAILGEYLGGQSNLGLGYAMIAAEQSLEVSRTWGLALSAAALGGLGYALFTLLARFALPWAQATSVSGGAS